MCANKIINDSSLGIIEFPNYIKCIIDTKEFQRLRWISQVGFCSFVYPSASQSRFIHSIGTYSLASELIKNLKSQLINKSELEITDKDVKCVEIAALCHDLGHGPFSHFWEVVTEEIPSDHQGDISHEGRYKQIWLRLIKNNQVRQTLLDNDIKDDEFGLIERLINGECLKGDKEILFQIVNNKESALDVDKLEYLCRDTRAFGQKASNFIIEVKRLFRFAKPLQDNNGKWKIAYRDTEKENLLEIFKLRYYNFKRGYCHKTVHSIELMFLDGFKRLVEQENMIQRNDLTDIDWILKQNDHKILTDYQDYEEFNRILERKLYRLVFEASTDELLDKGSKDELKVELKDLGINDRFRIKFVQFKLGVVKEKNGKYLNPLLKIPIYKKGNEKCYFIDKLPNHLIVDLDETLIRIFTIENDFKMDDDSYEKLEKYFKSKNWFIN